MSSCEHHDFHAEVEVSRIEEHAPTRFVAEIKIACHDCGTEFAFIGVPKRISTRRIGANLIRTRVSIPIEPTTPETRRAEIAASGKIEIDA